MREQQIINSSLWAAFGDSLGFVTELGDESTFQYRVNGKTKDWGRVEWRRKVGGQFGCQIDLPPGTYSDDTQLRLAVSRSINANGSFQKEAFAKIELPAWRCYALGAGSGSLASANNLTKKTVGWNSNFYNTKKINYCNGGGNGAAMRIQPHIWATSNWGHPNTYILDVFSDAIITHGHARGFLGAVFHGISLAMTLSYKKPLPYSQWYDILPFLENIHTLIKKDMFISTVWLSRWEEQTSSNFAEQTSIVVKEYKQYIDEFSKHKNGSPQERYYSFAKAIGAIGGRETGSSIKTTVLAAAAALLFQNEDPVLCLQTTASLFNSDTDTISTMTGALLGASVNNEPDFPIQDKDYLKKEAIRLYNIAHKIPEESFSYPSILKWTSPRNSIDQVKNYNNTYYIDGLCRIKLKEKQYSNNSAIWQFAETNFGQTILVKRRKDTVQVDQEPQYGQYHILDGKQTCDTLSAISRKKSRVEYISLLDSKTRSTEKIVAAYNIEDIKSLVQYVIANKFSSSCIGECILHIEKNCNYEHLIDFISLLHKEIQKNNIG